MVATVSLGFSLNPVGVAIAPDGAYAFVAYVSIAITEPTRVKKNYLGGPK